MKEAENLVQSYREKEDIYCLSFQELREVVNTSIGYHYF